MIGGGEKQGREFCFLKRLLELNAWTDAVPKDDPEFQGLLEEEEPAAYPNISAKLPEVELESEEEDFQVDMDEPAPDFVNHAAMALENVGINPNERIHQTHETAADGAPGSRLPAIIKANEDEVMYKITFDLPDLLPKDDVPSTGGCLSAQECA